MILIKCAMRMPKIQQNMDTLYLNTAFCIKKMCYVIIFIVSWLMIEIL